MRLKFFRFVLSDKSYLFQMCWTANNNERETRLADKLEPVLTTGIENRYSRYSHGGIQNNQHLVKKIKSKETTKIKSEAFVSMKMSRRSSIQFEELKRLEKEALPVKHTKASMGRQKTITQNRITSNQTKTKDFSGKYELVSK